MALSGINLAPAFAGQEAVWQRVRTGAEGRRGPGGHRNQNQQGGGGGTSGIMSRGTD